jgi:hypothetical protein
VVGCADFPLCSVKGVRRQTPSARYVQTVTASIFLKRVNTRATPFPCAPRHLKIAPGHGLRQRMWDAGYLHESRDTLCWQATQLLGCQLLSHTIKSHIAMNPAQTVQLYVQSCVELEGNPDAAIVGAMEQRGCPVDLAIEATRYAPIAFARQFLDGMGIMFSDEFLVLSSKGEIEERGTLSSHPLYQEALRVAPSIMSKQLINTVIFRSSEANAVNNALNAGSKPENLRLAPVLIFNGQPTEEGLLEAQRLTTSFLQAKPTAKTNTAKQWWRLW